MNTLKTIPRFPVYIVFTVVIFILDIFLHNYLVIWALYFYPLYHVSGVDSERQLKILTVLSCIFVILCYLLFLNSGSPDIHFWNRLFGLTLLLIFTFIMLKKVRTESALETSREEYSALFNTKSNAIGHFDIITDASGKPVDIRYVKINAAYEQIMNFVSEDVEGKLLSEVFPGIKNAPQDYIGRYGKVGIEGGELAFEDYFAPNDLWISAYVFSPQKNKIIVIFNDITKRKIAEKELTEALKKAEEGKLTFQSIGENIPYGVWQTDTEGRAIYISKSWCDMVGRTLEHVQEFGWLDTLIPEQRNRVTELWLNAVKTGEPFEHEHHFIDVNGNIKIVLARGLPVRGSDGNIVSWAGINLDITERKRVEERVKELNEQLIMQNAETESAKMRWQGIVESIPAEVWVCDLNGRIDLLNPGKVTFLGLGEFKGSSLEEILEEVEILNPDGKPRPEEETPLLRSLKGEFIQGEEIMRHKKTGITRHRLYSSAAMRDINGNIKGSVAIVRDITDQKMNERKLADTLKELQRSNKELQQFAYTASHDLQEPIRMIKSYAALIDLKYNKFLDDSTQAYLGFISEGAARMQQLIDGLLSYSRINTKQNSFERMDCNELVNIVLSDLELAINEAEAEVVVNDLPEIFGDKTQMRQVFQNLIQNSLKFRNKGKTIIEISCEKTGRMWRFSVKDNGIGIGKEYLERIFVIFQRLHIRDEYPGTGIGLAIVKKIIERHGGEVFAESEPGKGSVFYFTIPAQG